MNSYAQPSVLPDRVYTQPLQKVSHLIIMCCSLGAKRKLCACVVVACAHPSSPSFANVLRLPHVHNFLEKGVTPGLNVLLL